MGSRKTMIEGYLYMIDGPEGFEPVVYPCRLDVEKVCQRLQKHSGDKLLKPRAAERLLHKLEKGVISLYLYDVVSEFVRVECGYTPSIGDEYDLEIALFSLSGRRVGITIEAID